MKIDLRTVVCGYQTYEFCKNRFKGRPVAPEAYAPTGCFYWFNRFGTVRQVDTKTGIIYVLDHERGFPHIKPIRRWPAFKLARAEE